MASVGDRPGDQEGTRVSPGTRATRQNDDQGLELSKGSAGGAHVRAVPSPIFFLSFSGRQFFYSEQAGFFC